MVKHCRQRQGRHERVMTKWMGTYSQTHRGERRAEQSRGEERKGEERSREERKGKETSLVKYTLSSSFGIFKHLPYDSHTRLPFFSNSLFPSTPTPFPFLLSHYPLCLCCSVLLSNEHRDNYPGTIVAVKTCRLGFKSNLMFQMFH